MLGRLSATLTLPNYGRVARSEAGWVNRAFPAIYRRGIPRLTSEEHFSTTARVLMKSKPSQLTHSTFRKVDLWVLSSNTFFLLTR